ncbi:hypothetical protein F4556_001459 [Kitasatospora gansuensis]|uniref:Uncharacterized protein n=1 Tax=Kitasatospora gansuensis TaxID=258050 RepID=A0A7W7S8P9_9ACTN|nr:DUF6153 family protein [Kitasatospora gansuensis]MBB4945924.1 hypothetical protein [Kitasatospora gansuensis]
MHPERRRHRAHLRVLLVLATLLGVLAMHGLGAVPVTATAAAMSAEHQHHDSGDGDSDGGHDSHAGPMCLSGAVAVPFAPAPPGPAAPYGCGVPAPGPVGATSGEPDGGRAPPSLAELQLLRR